MSAVIGVFATNNVNGKCVRDQALSGFEGDLCLHECYGVSIQHDPVALDFTGEASTAPGYLPGEQCVFPKFSGPVRRELAMSRTRDRIFWNPHLGSKETTDKIHISAWRSHDDTTHKPATRQGVRQWCQPGPRKSRRELAGNPFSIGRSKQLCDDRSEAALIRPSAYLFSKKSPVNERGF